MRGVRVRVTVKVRSGFRPLKPPPCRPDEGSGPRPRGRPALHRAGAPVVQGTPPPLPSPLSPILAPPPPSPDLHWYCQAPTSPLSHTGVPNCMSYMARPPPPPPHNISLLHQKAPPVHPSNHPVIPSGCSPYCSHPVPPTLLPGVLPQGESVQRNAQADPGPARGPCPAPPPLFPLSQPRGG